MGSRARDLRFAARMLIRNPGFTAAALLSLGLGIGANTAIFSVINEVFLRPVPLVTSPDRLVAVGRTLDGKAFEGFSHPEYLEYRDHNQTFSGLMGYRGTELNLIHGGDALRIRGLLVTANYFSVLGVNAVLGRTFLPEEDRTPGSHPVAVLSHELWKNSFGSDTAILGKTLVLNGHDYTVIGITPRGFKGIEMGETAAVWLPMAMEGSVRPMFPTLNSRMFTVLSVVGRLRAGISMEQAQASMNTLARALEQTDSKTGKQRRATLSADVRFTDPEWRSEAARLLALLMGTAAMVLVIACTNVANLLLSRANARSKETAIRIALGAGRGRLMQQFLSESLFLSLLGGAVGLLIGFWMSNLPKVFLGGEFDFSPDTKVLTFTFLISVLSGILFGFAPALQVSKPAHVGSALKNTVAGGVSGSPRLRNYLVILQVALSLVLVTATGLLVRTMHNLRSLDLGFETRSILAMPIELRPAGYSAAEAWMIQSRLVDRVASLPGVRSACLADDLPVSGWFSGTRELLLEDRETWYQGRGIRVDLSVVSGNYFHTLGIPLLRGRDFGRQDQKESPPVAIVSETAAQQFWPGQDAIGKRFRIIEFMGRLSGFRQVIGVVKDTRYHRLDRKTAPHLYLPLSQSPELDTKLLVGASGKPQSIIEGVRREVRAIDQNLPVSDLRTLANLIAERDGEKNMTAALVSMFGLLALILAMIGLYGTVALAQDKTDKKREKLSHTLLVLL